MVSISEKIDIIPETRYFGPARVIEYDEANELVRVRFNRVGMHEKICKSWARIAFPLSSKLRYGESVLIAGGNTDDFYIIGTLESKASEKSVNESLKLQCGARAELSGAPNAEKLTVFSKEDDLIFEYDPCSGKTRIDIPRGDLEINTRNGSIVFSSSKDIRMVTSSDTGENSADLSMDSKKISMNSPEIDINSRKGTIHIDETEYSGNRFSGKIKTIKLIMNRLESVADTVIDKAKNVYRTVEGLTQLHTGRMRTIIKTTWHFKSKKTFMKAEEDFKIKGEKIYLG